MFFAQYIQLLHRHISQGMIQPDFTEDFLCHATDKIKKGDYSTSSYKRFFAGKTQGTGSEKRIIGDTIGPFAIKHLKINENEYKTRLSLLQAYLSEMIEKADAASQLANAFRGEIPAIYSVDITEMAKKLSDLYFEIINRAINDVSHSKGSCLLEPNHEVDAIPAAVRTNINEKINEIILLIDVMLQFNSERILLSGKDVTQCLRRIPNVVHGRNSRTNTTAIIISILNFAPYVKNITLIYWNHHFSFQSSFLSIRFGGAILYDIFLHWILWRQYKITSEFYSVFQQC